MPAAQVHACCADDLAVLAGCLGDQQAAVLGQRCGPGTAKSTYGTGCFVLLHTGPRPVASAHGLLTTVAHRLGADAEPQYALEVRAAAGRHGYITAKGLSYLKMLKEGVAPNHMPCLASWSLLACSAAQSSKNGRTAHGPEWPPFGPALASARSTRAGAAGRSLVVMGFVGPVWLTGDALQCRAPLPRRARQCPGCAMAWA